MENMRSGDLFDAAHYAPMKADQLHPAGIGRLLNHAAVQVANRGLTAPIADRRGDLRLRQARANQVGDKRAEVHALHFNVLTLNRNNVLLSVDNFPLCMQEGKQMASDNRPTNTVGARLRDARKLRKLTQAQLAARASMAQGTISDLENGRNQTSSELPILGMILGVNPLWLQTGKGPREPDAVAKPVEQHKQINTALMIECWRAAETYVLKAGAALGPEETLQLACRLYEQHADTPNRKAAELVSYLTALTKIMDMVPR